jgi:hypothetical protein
MVAAKNKDTSKPMVRAMKFGFLSLMCGVLSGVFALKSFGKLGNGDVDSKSVFVRVRERRAGVELPIAPATYQAIRADRVVPERRTQS